MAFTTSIDPYQTGIQSVTNQDQDLIIQTKGLKKVFGDFVAVEKVTFRIPRGTIFGFIGPSGAGKTTTIRMLTGVYRPTEGEVIVLGRHPYNFTQGMRSRVGYMPQLFVLYPNLTVWENLNFAASLYGMGLARSRWLEDILDFVELSDHKHKLARDISGGMQRRLSLAATLIHNPELVFLDEPTAGIDPVLRRKFWEHFSDLQNKGATIFITTQYVNEAAYCDTVGVLSNNRLLMVDTPDGLRKFAYGGEIVELRSSERIEYRHEQLLRDLPFVKGNVIRTSPNTARIIVEDAGRAMPALIEWARDQGLKIESIEQYTPPFEEVFVELVKEDTHD